MSWFEILVMFVGLGAGGASAVRQAWRWWRTRNAPPPEVMRALAASPYRIAQRRPYVPPAIRFVVSTADLNRIANVMPLAGVSPDAFAAASRELAGMIQRRVASPVRIPDDKLATRRM